MRYNVEYLAAGEPSRRIVRRGVTVTTYGPRRRATYLRTLLRIYLHLRSARFDILHCAELESLIIAVIVSRLKAPRPAIVYDAHEYFPSLITNYFKLPKPLAVALELLLGVVERFFASFCDAFIVVNEDLAERFLAFRKPLAIVRNLPSLSWFDNARTIHVLEDVDCPVVIATAIGRFGGLLEILQANSILNKAGRRVCFVLAGRVRQSDSQILRTAIRQGVRVEGWIANELLPSFLKRASVGLALYSPAEASSKTQFFSQRAEPMKLYDYMIAGLPIVATDLPAIRALVSRENCGVLVNPGDADEIADAISKLLDDEKARASMGKGGRQAAEREYNWETESNRFLSLYHRIERELINRTPWNEIRGRNRGRLCRMKQSDRRGKE
jgi:glycosyltransferase involved in cell wall biosynthesis